MRSFVPGTLTGREPAVLIESDFDHVKGTAFNMLFMVWRRRTLSEAYRRGLKVARELATKFPEGIGVCQVVEVDAIPPDSEARSVFVEFMKLPGLKHYSVTHDGVGFKAAAVRAIIMSVNSLARPRCKHEVHSTVSAAAAWHTVMQAELGRHETPEDIAQIINALRAFHRDTYPA
jgi:hypothetical protein